MTDANILLVAHTRLSLGYVLDHYRLLSQDPALQFTLTRAPDQYSAGTEDMMDATGLPRLPYCAAVRRPWDLALFGTHGSEIYFTHAAARVHIQHGMGGQASSSTGRTTPTARNGRYGTGSRNAT